MATTENGEKLTRDLEESTKNWENVEESVQEESEYYVTPAVYRIKIKQSDDIKELNTLKQNTELPPDKIKSITGELQLCALATNIMSILKKTHLLNEMHYISFKQQNHMLMNFSKHQQVRNYLSCVYLKNSNSTLVKKIANRYKSSEKKNKKNSCKKKRDICREAKGTDKCHNKESKESEMKAKPCGGKSKLESTCGETIIPCGKNVKPLKNLYEEPDKKDFQSKSTPGKKKVSDKCSSLYKELSIKKQPVPASKTVVKSSPKTSQSKKEVVKKRPNFFMRFLCNILATFRNIFGSKKATKKPIEKPKDVQEKKASRDKNSCQTKPPIPKKTYSCGEQKPLPKKEAPPKSSDVCRKKVESSKSDKKSSCKDREIRATSGKGGQCKSEEKKRISSCKEDEKPPKRTESKRSCTALKEGGKSETSVCKGKLKSDKHAGEKSDFNIPKEICDKFKEKTKLDDDIKKKEVCTDSKKKSSTSVSSKQKDGDKKKVSCAEKIPPKKRKDVNEAKSSTRINVEKSKSTCKDVKEDTKRRDETKAKTCDDKNKPKPCKPVDSIDTKYHPTFDPKKCVKFKHKCEEQGSQTSRKKKEDSPKSQTDVKEDAGEKCNVKPIRCEHVEPKSTERSQDKTGSHKASSCTQKPCKKQSNSHGDPSDHKTSCGDVNKTESKCNVAETSDKKSECGDMKETKDKSNRCETTKPCKKIESDEKPSKQTHSCGDHKQKD